MNVLGRLHHIVKDECEVDCPRPVYNCRPRNMRGIKSFGMLLAASNDAHDVVEPLAPPAGAAPGTRVWFGQHQEQVG